MNRFRLLRANEIECRVSTLKEDGLSLLLYKTARTDANLLDETIGPEHWENDFKIVDGVLYGGIGVDYGNGMIWKWDAGVESNTEAEKGRASDAFKRAGFKHGIGRELYTAPFIWIRDCNIKKNDRGKLVCYDSFAVDEISYNKAQEIASVSIVNTKTKQIVYRWASDDNDLPFTFGSEEAKEEPINEVFTPRCSECKKEITDKVHDYSVRYYKRPLCRECQDKLKNESANR